MDIGAVEYRYTSISGTVFNDANGNGVQDAGEKGLAGQTVFLDLNKNGKLDAGEPTATTNGAGFYSFAREASGSYRVEVVQPTGWVFTSPVGGDADISLTPGQSLTKLNFGLRQTAKISGKMFLDANANGKLDCGEAGLSGVKAYIDVGRVGHYVNGDPTAISNANGNYTFSNLLPGSYNIAAMTPSAGGRPCRRNGTTQPAYPAEPK